MLPEHLRQFRGLCAALRLSIDRFTSRFCFLLPLNAPGAIAIFINGNESTNFHQNQYGLDS
jgi:hypothetical protein